MSENFDKEAAEQLIEFIGEKDFEEFKEIILRKGQEGLEAIEAGLETQNVKVITETAHTMKSSFGTIGLTRVKDVAETIEGHGRDILEGGDTNSVDFNELYQKLKQVFESGAEELRNFP